jgi:hypothetical protein
VQRCLTSCVNTALPVVVYPAKHDIETILKRRLSIINNNDELLRVLSQKSMKSNVQYGAGNARLPMFLGCSGRS